jgi:DNA repair exonuclease SbcCD ATPase subunit
MIKFKTIKFKNILSYGNSWSEFAFETGVTRIMGKNGDGKSAITEAIYFSLWGKPYRNINQGQLINSINRTGLEVILDFDLNSFNYRIERGIKPNFFRIFKKEDSTRDFTQEDLVPVSSASRTYQQILEEDILSMNSDIFDQTTLKSLTRNISFFTLKKADKRDITENILGIKIFTGMNKVCKAKVDALEKELISLNKDFDYTEILISQEKDNITKLKEIKKKQEEERIERVAQATKDIVQFREENIKFQEGVDRIQKYKTKKEELKKKHDDLLDKKTEVQQSLIGLMSDINKVALENKKKIQENIDLKYAAIKESKENTKGLVLKEAQEIEELQQEIKKVEQDIKTYEVMNAGIQSKIDVMTKNCSDCPKAKELTEGSDGSIAKNLDIISKFNDEIAEHKKTIEKHKEAMVAHDLNFENVETDITAQINSLKLTLVDEDKKAATDIAIKSEDIQSEINDIQTKMDDLKEPVQKCDEFINREQGFLVNIQRNNTEIVKREAFIIKSADAFDGSVDMTKLRGYVDKKKELTTTVNEKTDDKTHYAFIRTMLSDDAIKTFVIGKYLPVINKILNSYLQKFGSDVIFNFDSEFDEQIVSRHKDGFSYESFSEGQKRRIDLAVLFTFIEFCKIKFSNASNNLLILDEVGAGLDSEGDNILLELLRDLKERENKCVLTITHSNNLNPHRIDSIFECTMEKGFSKIEKKTI